MTTMEIIKEAIAVALVTSTLMLGIVALAAYMILTTGGLPL